ncbi:hypothetical protein JCM10295v2_002776 [Rhodotorula toruloides]
MSTLTFKISSHSASGPATLRRLTLTSPPDFITLENAVRQRFGVAGPEVALCYLDDEGDWIALEELQELLQSLDGNSRTVRLQLTAPSTPVEQVPTPASAAHTSQQPSGGEGEYASADEWLDVGTPGDASFKSPEVDEPTPVGTPTLLFDVEDPAEASLAAPETASLADETRALIEAEFPRPASPASAAADDPADEPIPSTPAANDPRPAFTTLPASLSGLLTGLPSHANSFTTHLSALLTSPDSALGRLSALLQDPTATLPSASDLASLDLRDLSASLAAVRQDVTRAIREVVDGVRREAEGARHEFDELKRDFEREKRRFEEDVRRAMEQARAAQGVAPATSDSGVSAAPATTSTATSTDPLLDAESSAARAARRAIRQAKKQQRAARRFEKAQRKLARRARREREAELLARAQDDLLKASSESLGDESAGGEGVEMRSMPGGMPASFAAPSAPVQQPFASTSAYNPAYPPTSPASSSSSTSSTSTSTATSSDDDKPILLTKFLLAAAELGFDVNEHATRIALTDVWCESNGRGLSRMVERACDELL